MLDLRQIGPMVGELVKFETAHTFRGSIWNGTLSCLVGDSWCKTNTELMSSATVSRGSWKFVS